MTRTVRGSHIAIGSAVLLAIVLLVAWWQYTFVHVTRTITLPPRGEAAYNPLYALKLALAAQGVPVQSRQQFRFDTVPLGRDDTLVLLGDPRTLSQREVDGVLRWIAGGGHLVLRTPPLQRGDADIGPQQLLAQLAVVPSSQQSGCEELSRGVPDKTGDKQFLFCTGARFTMAGVEPLSSWGNLRDGYVYARIARAAGTVDVLADLDELTNDRLDDAPNDAFARQLLAPGWKRGQVHLVYAASMPPLWRLVLAKAWMAWVPLMLATGAWLWMRMQRFGPLQPSPEIDRRALLEHVQMSGEHLWRYGRGAVLYDGMRAAFMARLRRRDPYAAALDGAVQHAAIATHTGLPVDDIAHALQSPRPNDAADFRLRIARLIQMRQRL